MLFPGALHEWHTSPSFVAGFVVGTAGTTGLLIGCADVFGSGPTGANVLVPVTLEVLRAEEPSDSRSEDSSRYGT